MKDKDFGIEVELTGITRAQAAEAVRNLLGGTTERKYDGYDTYAVKAPDGRVWKLMSDASITTQTKMNGKITAVDKSYSVELVSPILTYEKDINTLQEIIRVLRRTGGFTNASTGIHVHISGEGHTPRSVRNFINIIASKNDLFYKALQIEPERVRYCKALDSILVEKMNSKKPTTMEQIADIWYAGYQDNRDRHYHSS